MEIVDEEQSVPLADVPASGSSRWFPTGPVPWIVIGVGVGLRLLWATVGARAPRILADPGIYYQAALRIANGQGYVSFNEHPTAYYPPGYPWFLGSFQWVLERVGAGSHTIGAVAILQSILSGVAIAAVIVVGARLGGRRVGILSGVVLALWPNLVVHASLMLSETLFVTLLSVALAAIVTMVEPVPPGPSAAVVVAETSTATAPVTRMVWWRAVVAGLALGAATLVRPQVLLVVAAIVAGWFLCRLPLRDVLRRTLVLAVGVVVVVAPWTVRNAIVFGSFIPVSTNDGDNLCVGFNPESVGYFAMPESCDTGEFYTDGTDAELRRQAETRRRAVEYIREHPTALPELTWKKLWYTYRSDTDGVWASSSFGEDPWLRGAPRQAFDVVSTVFYAAVMLLAVAGAVVGWRRSWAGRRVDPTAVVLVLGAVASSLIPVLFFGDPRFKVGGTPFYAALAAVALAALSDRWAGRFNRPGASDRRASAAPNPATPPPGPSTAA